MYMQAVVASFAGVCLYWVLCQFFSKRYSAVFSILIFSDYLILNWHSIVLTESLSISLLTISVFLKMQLAVTNKRITLSRATGLNVFLDICLCLVKPTFFFFSLGVYMYLILRKRVAGDLEISFARLLSLFCISCIFSLMGMGKYFYDTGDVGFSDLQKYAKVGQLISIGALKSNPCINKACSHRTKAYVMSYEKLDFSPSPFAVANEVSRKHPQWTKVDVLKHVIEDLGKNQSVKLWAKRFRNISSMMSGRSYYQTESVFYELFFYRTFYEVVRRVSKLLGLPVLIFALYTVVVGIYRQDIEISSIILGLAFLYLTFVTAFANYIEWGRMIAPALPSLHAYMLVCLTGLRRSWIKK